MDSRLATEERASFSARLTQALTGAGYGHAPLAISREFNRRADGAAVTVHAARKWLKGESIPTQEKIHVLARWLDVPAQWLRFGDEGDAPAGPATDSDRAQRHFDRLIVDDLHRLDPHDRVIVRQLVNLLLEKAAHPP